MNIRNKKWLIIYIVGLIILRLFNSNNYLLILAFIIILAGAINAIITFRNSKWSLLKMFAIIIITGLIAMTIFLVSLNNVRLKNADESRERDIKEIQLILKDYADQNEGNYPNSLSELKDYFPDRYFPTYFGDTDTRFKYTTIDYNHYCLYTELETRNDVYFANEREFGFGNSNCTKN